jgi:hypothetical protein
MTLHGCLMSVSIVSVVVMLYVGLRDVSEEAEIQLG